MKDKPKGQNFPPKIKWVKAAGMFCLTYWENGEAKRKWFNTNYEAEAVRAVLPGVVEVKGSDSRRVD